MKININDCVLVRLTPYGEKLWAEHWTRFPETGFTNVPDAVRKSVTEPDGRIRFQLWDMMAVFGKAMYNGNPNIPFQDNVIYIEDQS